MRIIVTGSRDWPEEETGLTIVLSTLQGAFNLNVYSGQPLTVVHGACPTGVDAIVSRWVARTQQWRMGNKVSLPGTEVIEEPHSPEWEKWGKGAGPIRNQYMANLGANFCLAFLYEPDGRVSKGTRDMIRAANRSRIPVIEVPWSF